MINLPHDEFFDDKFNTQSTYHDEFTDDEVTGHEIFVMKNRKFIDLVKENSKIFRKSWTFFYIPYNIKTALICLEWLERFF